MTGVDRLARIVLNTADAERLAAFYVDVFGFEHIATHDGVHALALGGTRLDLRAVAGRPYPADVAGWSPLFQHCAIVVSDLEAAMAALRRSTDWTAISTDGPQRLPANAGHVTAFKFRDPEGHPLELLSFPDRIDGKNPASPFERIDHSAISVADVARSLAFYRDLGLIESGRTLNTGSEQQRLDAIPNPEVDVISLALPSGAKPRLELLGYRGPFDRTRSVAEPDDVVATRLVFTVADATILRTLADRHSQHRVGISCLRDPDGHLVQLEVADA